MAIWETGCPEIEASARAKYQYSSWVEQLLTRRVVRYGATRKSTWDRERIRPKGRRVRSDVKRRGFSHQNSISGSCLRLLRDSSGKKRFRILRLWGKKA